MDCAKHKAVEAACAPRVIANWVVDPRTLAASYERAKLALDVAKVGDEKQRAVNERHSFKKMATEMDILLDDDDAPKTQEDDDADQPSQAKKRKIQARLPAKEPPAPSTSKHNKHTKAAAPPLATANAANAAANAAAVSKKIKSNAHPPRVGKKIITGRKKQELSSLLRQPLVSRPKRSFVVVNAAALSGR